MINASKLDAHVSLVVKQRVEYTKRIRNFHKDSIELVEKLLTALMYDELMQTHVQLDLLNESLLNMNIKGCFITMTNSYTKLSLHQHVVNLCDKVEDENPNRNDLLNLRDQYLKQLGDSIDGDQLAKLVNCVYLILHTNPFLPKMTMTNDSISVNVIANENEERF